MIGILITALASTVSGDESISTLIRKQKIATLIQQLGSRQTTKRDAATRRLYAMMDIAQAQLEAAMKNSEGAIQRRIAIILKNFERRRIKAELDAKRRKFVQCPGDVMPRSWRQYSQVVGDDLGARKFFVAMCEAAPALMNAYEEDPRLATDELNWCWEARIEAWRNERRRVGRDYFVRTDLPVDSAILLVGGDDDVPPSVQIEEGLKSFRGWLDDPAYAPIPHKLFCRWIGRSVTDDYDEAMYRLNAAWRALNALDRTSRKGKTVGELRALNDLKEVAADLAVSMLEKGLGHVSTGETSVAQIKSRLIAYVGLFGSRQQVSAVEPFLNDQQIVRSDLEVRDIALRTLLHLTNQDSLDYGFADGPIRTSRIHSTILRKSYFKSAAHRQRAVAKWDAWAEENLQNDQHDIAGETERRPS